MFPRLNGIKKYTALAEKCLDRITPNVSDTLGTDELFLKVKGNTKSLYALIYNNYVRQHEALNGKAPSEAVGYQS